MRLRIAKKICGRVRQSLEERAGPVWQAAQIFPVVPSSDVDDDPTQPGFGPRGRGSLLLRQVRGGIPRGTLLAAARRLSTFDRAFMRLQKARNRARRSDYASFVGMTNLSW